MPIRYSKVTPEQRDKVMEAFFRAREHTDATHATAVAAAEGFGFDSQHHTLDSDDAWAATVALLVNQGCIFLDYEVPQHVKEVEIMAREGPTYEPAGSENRVKVDRSDEIAKYKIGAKFAAEVAAPGTGRIVYRITRIDVHGMCGVVIEDTSRDLRPDEVR